MYQDMRGRICFFPWRLDQRLRLQICWYDILACLIRSSDSEVAGRNMAFILELRRRRGHSGSMLLAEISPRGGEIKGRPRSQEIPRERAEMHEPPPKSVSDDGEGEGVVGA